MTSETTPSRGYSQYRNSQEEVMDNESSHPEKPMWLDVREMDFRDAPTFAKIADPDKAVSVEVAQDDTVVETIFTKEDGTKYVETVNTAKIGDYIITGPKGEKYVLGRDTFNKMYHKVSINGETKYIAKNVVKAIENPTGREIEIDAPWGGKQLGDKDCMIVESQINGDRYLIDKSAFEATYKPTEEQ